MRLYTVILYFLQIALHVSYDTLIHHQKHIQTVTEMSGIGWAGSSTSVDGRKYGPTNARCCSYSLNLLLMMDEGIIQNM